MSGKKMEHLTQHQRLLKVRLISLGVSIISVYAPTEVDEDTEAERFYDELQDLVINANKKDMLIILGDFNARVGPSETHLHERYNPDKRNENGTRLVDFCHRNGLLLANTLFPHKKIHQCTWYHPGTKEGHVLDYILISQKCRAQICDTRVYRKTVDTSEHNLLTSIITMKKYKTRYRKPINTNVLNNIITNAKDLKPEYIAKFKDELQNRMKNIHKYDSVEEI